MSLLGLITVKIICFYGLGNILYFFLIINKTEILVLSKKKKKKMVDTFLACFSCCIS